MSVTFKLIYINKFLSLLRPITFVLAFLPLFFVKNMYSSFISVWILFFMIMFFIQLFLVKRYKIIGTIKITEVKIEILHNNEGILSFFPSDKLRLFIRINGFRGESTQILFITFSEGIGRLEIYNDNNRFKFDILAEKSFYKNLVEILNMYKQKGVCIDLSKR